MKRLLGIATLAGVGFFAYRAIKERQASGKQRGPQVPDHSVQILNGLIKTTLDSVGGYRDASETVDDGQYKALFGECASKRQRLASELQQQVRTLGGQPETDQGIVGKMHNKFVELKSVVTGGSDKAVVDEVERGEDHIKEKFEHALEEEGLPTGVRIMLTSAYQTIKTDHDEVSRIKHSLH